MDDYVEISNDDESLISNHSNNELIPKNDELIPNEDLSNLNDDTLTSIARSAFADMLWDQERNYYYKKAIDKVLSKLLIDKKNNQINCLDIGAGSGLLSMFMVRTLNEFSIKYPMFNNNNKKVIALEQFFYSYLTANEIINLNKMNNKIELIYKNSLVNELPEHEKCHFLATEVFDTELIGEGALEIFRDAKKRLLNLNSLIVPKRAYIYCQLIESKFLTNGHLFRQIRIKDGINDNSKTILLNYCEGINDCPGSCAQLNDMQLNSLGINEFKIISDVKIAFTIDFENPPFNELDINKIKFKIIQKPKSFTNVCVAVWWDLNMDSEGEFVLSCAPYWARFDVNYDKVFKEEPIDDVLILFNIPNKEFNGERSVENDLSILNNYFINYFRMNDQFKGIIEENFEKLRISSQWRDHWMQAVYYLPKDSFLNYNLEDDLLEIQAFRNDYQFWFNYQNNQQSKKKKQQSNLDSQPACVCGYHRVYSRNQIRQINDPQLTAHLTVQTADIYREFKFNLSDFNNEQIKENLNKKLKKDCQPCNILVVGGLGIISLILAKIIPESVIYLVNQTGFCPFYKEIIYKERLEHKFLGVKDYQNFDAKIDIIIKDPLNDPDKLPWLDIHEFLLVFRSILGKQIPLALPNKIIFRVLPVCFDHLWKIRYVIKKIDGLDLSPFNKMINRALEIESRKIEMYSLHEYDGIALGQSQMISQINLTNLDSYKGSNSIIFDFNLTEIHNQLFKLYGRNEIEQNRSIFDQQLDKIVPFRRQLTNIGFVIWPEYVKLINTGPFNKPTFLNRINWNKLYKQAVYFMPEFNYDYLKENKFLKIEFNLKYDLNDTKNQFNFSHRNLTDF